MKIVFLVMQIMFHFGNDFEKQFIHVSLGYIGNVHVEVLHEIIKRTEF